MTMYKLSKYTHFLSPSNSAGHYVYNAISNGLATLDNRIYELLQPSGDGIGILEGEGTAESAALLNQLRSGHIIVENDFDEIDFLRIKMNLARYSTRGLTHAELYARCPLYSGLCDKQFKPAESIQTDSPHCMDEEHETLLARM